jgi:sphingomyelin phosphodiesterase 2
VTCDSKLNTFRPRDLETTTNDPNAKRIDYIFTSKAAIDSSEVTLTELIAGHDINYSDHYGVSTTLYLTKGSSAYQGRLTPRIFISILDITFSYIHREESRSLMRTLHSYLSLVFCFAMLVTVWFVQQKGTVFVMMLLSMIVMLTGVVDWIIGFVWGRMELRALKEFTSEMELARSFYA